MYLLGAWHVELVLGARRIFDVKVRARFVPKIGVSFLQAFPTAMHVTVNRSFMETVDNNNNDDAFNETHKSDASTIVKIAGRSGVRCASLLWLTHFW